MVYHLSYVTNSHLVRPSNIPACPIQCLLHGAIAGHIRRVVITEFRNVLHDPRRIHVSANIRHGPEAINEPVELEHTARQQGKPLQ